MEQEKDESELVHLDDRLLETPSFAVQSAVLEVVRMGYIVEKNLNIWHNEKKTQGDYSYTICCRPCYDTGCHSPHIL